MSSNKIRHLASTLLLLYLGYFGCVSYFVHKHVYNGVIYIHSHPYKKQQKDADKDAPPFETHNHTAAGFFTLNQLSNYTSFGAEDINICEAVETPKINEYVTTEIATIETNDIAIFRLRAPPRKFS